MNRFTAAALIFIMPLPAFAETQLERFEGVAIAMNVAMVDMFAREVEEGGGDATALRELDRQDDAWSDEMRAAAACMLEGYAEEAGEAAVDEMLGAFEVVIPQAAEMTMTEFSDSDMAGELMPDGLTQERALEINSGCGFDTLQMAAARDSGFVEAMMAAMSTVPD